ncbi:response regulator transcription factor [Terrabacter sp. 2RAF25]|uniref:response regulator transcription factor n=1 Tax=Terrabacter sp. 2RAF25 TaxID=3232998 RepID=UPI003F996C4B
MATQVLLVEDDNDIAGALVMALARDDYEVTRAANGLTAVDHVASRTTHVVLLDLGLPDIDGLEVCRRIRANGYDGVVIILTARGGELDRVVGLDVGADDYMSKPFSLSELLARIRATLRRGWAATTPPEEAPAPAAANGDPGHDAPPATQSTSTASAPGTASAVSPVGGLSVDTRSRRAFVSGGELALTAKEFDVLALLDAERGAAITREQLMNEVWDENWFGSTKTLDATVGRLRQKLETAASPARIATVRGVGFRLEDEPPDA